MYTASLPAQQTLRNGQENTLAASHYLTRSTAGQRWESAAPRTRPDPREPRTRPCRRHLVPSHTAAAFCSKPVLSRATCDSSAEQPKENSCCPETQPTTEDSKYSPPPVGSLLGDQTHPPRASARTGKQRRFVSIWLRSHRVLCNRRANACSWVAAALAPDFPGPELVTPPLHAQPPRFLQPRPPVCHGRQRKRAAAGSPRA